MKLPTQWEGTYSYDPVPELPSRFVDTNFLMDLRLGWFGRFTGEIRDKEPGIPDPATVKGWATSDRIRFTKTYLSFWTLDEHGNSIRLPNLDPYVVHYDGRLDRDEECERIEGTWYIAPSRLRIGGKLYETQQTTGTWIARSSAQDDN